ncbi:hypothetical protein FC820_09455 [Clostridium sporogenes]|uniref:hypothetical protein n=1 Tax=Clostridium sporogenes TaxID=1509 RepID=UPI0013CF5A16|nr:hypothetical protein [Clostridium sporogenes]NFE79996.1 hypothetical protein [Clostridium sporogenes]NFG68546.1 hypothetical protein [Clostridium sporogenes]
MKTIREVEENILDLEYKKYRILKRSYNTAIIHLLKVYGDLYRDFRSDDTLELSYYHKQYSLSFLTGGLARCIKWIAIENNQLNEEHTISREIDKEAIDFLIWGYNYERLTNEHVALNRGLCEGTIDPEKKTIEFISKEQIPNMNISQFEFDRLYIEKIEQSAPLEELKNNFNEWYEEFKFSFDEIDIPWEKVRDLEVYNHIINWLRDEFFFDLRKETTFGSYGVEDFVKVYSALFINFIYYTWYEDYIDLNFGLENHLGSCIVTLGMEDFISWLSEMSLVERKKVNEIVNDLTINLHNFHSKLVFQPFICLNDIVYVSPRLLISIDPRRMFFGAINSVKKPIYDSIVKSIEEFNLQEIESYLKGLNCEIYIDKKISKRGKVLTPDLLLVDRKNKIFVIGDYKHFLRPIGILDVSNKSGEVIKAIKQINEYYDFINDEDIKVKEENFNFTCYKGYKLLLFQFPMPLPLNEDEDIIIYDWTNLQQILMVQEIYSLKELIHYIERKVANIKINSCKYSFVSQDINVGEWTYKKYIYVAEKGQ